MSRVLLQVLLPLLAVLIAVPVALAQGESTTVATTAVPASNGPTTAPHDPQSGGLAPLPNDQHVPTKWLPPGSFDPDTGPSPVVYPPQNLTIRFNHKLHLSKDIGTNCKACHAGAYTSTSAKDRLLPPGTMCDTCHDTTHDDLNKVEPGSDEKGQCAFCHVGYKSGDGNRVAQLHIPSPNLLFNHKKHADRNIGCGQCHGAVQELELSTRDQLPRMRGCFGCHQMSDSASRGDAKSNCETCHIAGIGTEGGRLKTLFASGKLLPPRWLHNAAHTPDFIERHKYVAGNDSAFCANCHSEPFCTDCHDGRVRPRSIHPNDYLSMHPIEARREMQKCTSCHREQSFCLDCHNRVGVSMSGAPGARNTSRFHPPKSIWSDPPRKPGSHGFEAERNLNACVSCHIERDCTTCHGAQGVGAGFNPHRAGFANSCGTQFRRNPRPCFVCHQPNDGDLAPCR
jgi:hypothetical protein